MSTTHRKLWCFADGHNPFLVDASLPMHIAELAVMIRDSIMIDVAPSKLILWKPRGVIPVKPSETLAQRLGNLALEPSQLAERLDPVDLVADKYPIQTQTPTSFHLDIFVQCPSSPQDGETSGVLESPSKRRRLADDPSSWLEEARSVDPAILGELQKFWEELWQGKSGHFGKLSVTRDHNHVGGVDIPATMEVLYLPQSFSPIGCVLVRDDYAVAMRDIEGYCANRTRSVVIVGHPGIGKTILLYYILVKRLLKQQPTILQNDPGHLFLFNAKGVKAVSSSNRVFPGSSEYENMWALVDIDPDIQKPARMVRHETSPFFLVMASSPRPSRLRELQKHGQPGAYWLMKPFTLVELIQARQLQRIYHNESDIENFFEKYGPSARDCYNFCKADALDQYISDVRAKVKATSWDLITEIMTSHPADINMEAGSHQVLLVEPQPNDRTVPRTRIVTKTVGQFLWEQDEDQKWRNQ